jgi:competence protein ComEC
VSFQLSFAAVAGIMLFGSSMQQAVVSKGRVWQSVSGLLIVSLAAQLGTMPLTLHYFGQTSNYFALTNLIVVPMAGILLSLGFSTLAMSWCAVGEWLGWATKWCTWLLNQAVQWIESLPYSTTHIHLSEWGGIGLYGAIICGLLMMRGGKVHWWWIIGVIICLIVVLRVELIV